jgi:hypothetical protein
MTARPVLIRALVVVASGAAAAVVAYAARAEFLAALLPPIGWIVDALLPDGIARTMLAVVQNGGQSLIALDVALTRPMQTGSTLVPLGETIHATTLAAYALQHVALVYAVLVAWPVSGARARAAMLLVGLPAVTAAVLLDIPFVLAGLVHDLLIDAGAAEKASSGLALYYEFLHRGGRAGLSIAVAVAVCLPFGARVAESAAHDYSRGVRLERGGARRGETGGGTGVAQQPPAFE